VTPTGKKKRNRTLDLGSSPVCRR